MKKKELLRPAFGGASIALALGLGWIATELRSGNRVVAMTEPGAGSAPQGQGGSRPGWTGSVPARDALPRGGRVATNLGPRNSAPARSWPLSTRSVDPAVPSMGAEAFPVAPSAAAATPAAGPVGRLAAAARVEYRAFFEREWGETAAALGLSEDQGRAGCALIHELFERYFREGTTWEEVGREWPQYAEEWERGLRALLTADQEADYDGYRARQRELRVATNTESALESLGGACALTSEQEERLRVRLRELYREISVPIGCWEAVRWDPSQRDQIKDTLGAELGPDQQAGFAEWYQSFLALPVVDDRGGEAE